MFELLSSNVLKLNTVFGAKTLISKRSSVQYKITVGYKITEFTLTRIFHPDWNKIKVPCYARFLYTSNIIYIITLSDYCSIYLSGEYLWEYLSRNLYLMFLAEYTHSRLYICRSLELLYKIHWQNARNKFNKQFRVRTGSSCSFVQSWPYSTSAYREVYVLVYIILLHLSFSNT